MKIATLGPSGTFSESSLNDTMQDTAFEIHFANNLDDLFLAVDNNTADLAWLPLWNSGCGFLTDDNDKEFLSLLLENNKHYTIVSGAFKPLVFALLGMKGAKTSDIKTVHVNPYVTIICKNFFKEHPKLTIITDPSSSNAVMKVAELNDPTVAASSSPKTGHQYGLDILQENMATNEEQALMQFILFGKHGNIFLPSPGNDKIMTGIILQSESAPKLAQASGLDILAIRQSSQLQSTYLLDIHGEHSTEKLAGLFSDALLCKLDSYPESPLHLHIKGMES